MKLEYVKYREFLRNFASVIDEMLPGTLYEIVGGKGESKGFFSLTNPYEHEESV